MNETGEKTYSDFVLPANIVSKVDLSRMISDLERVDNEMTEQEVREKTGAHVEPHPAMSEQLSEFLSRNELDIRDEHVRGSLIKQLHILKDQVPVIHMTFSAPADPESLQEIAHWMRESVHPQAVISVGLQPALIAGVYLRTPNKVHDLSLRTKLRESSGLLVKELEALRGTN